MGRTILRVERGVDEQSQGGDEATLYLDDGRTVAFSGWGHDWCGLTVEEVEMIDVAECLACGQPHPASRVFRENGRGRAAPHAFCSDGNRIAWRGES